MTTPTAAAIDKLKTQLVQLDALVADGTLSAEAAKPARDELQRRIVQAVLDAPASASTLAAASAPVQAGVPTAPPARAPRRLVTAVTVFVLAFGLAGYAAMGNRAGLRVGPGERGEVAAASPADQQADAKTMVAQLEERLKAQPDDAEGWQMVARSYSIMGRHADAVKAYQRLVALKPQDAQALADLADATAMINGRTLEGEPERLILQAVKLDPSNVKALALAGTLAFNRSDFKKAVSYWEQAVAKAEPGSGYVQQLTGALEEARQRAGLPPAAGSAANVAEAPPADLVAAAASPASIRGRVTLRGSLKDRVSPDDTVFIFARAPTGSRMPLAILRKKVSDLPLEFTLDDSLAMSPAARLSSTQQVVVGARVSKSGNAAPGPGDLQALSAPVSVKANGVNLEIGDPIQ
jgi:cytochrome c-type biogenesis protein CcmH